MKYFGRDKLMINVNDIENSKNWNCEFSCGASRRCDDVLYN